MAKELAKYPDALLDGRPLTWLRRKFEMEPIEDLFDSASAFIGAQLSLSEDYTNPGNVWIPIPFDVVDIDSHTYTAVADGSFIVPGGLTGMYVFSITLAFDDIGINPEIAIWRNGTERISVGSVVNVDGSVTTTGQGICFQDDVITAEIKKSAGSQVVFASGEVPARFSIAMEAGAPFVLEPAPCNPPVNTIPPEVTPTDGTSFTDRTSDDGTWTGDDVITFTYQWYWAETEAGPFDTSLGATFGAQTPTLTQAPAGVDEGDGDDGWVVCRVTATNNCGIVSADSNPSRVLNE